MSRNDKRKTLAIQMSTWEILAKRARYGMNADDIIRELLEKVQDIEQLERYTIPQTIRSTT